MIQIPKKKTLEDKLNVIKSRGDVSLLPPKRKVKEPEIIPELSVIITNKYERSAIERLSNLIRLHGEEEYEAKRAKAPLVLELKAELVRRGVTEKSVMLESGLKLSHYEVPRSSINVQKLLAHGVSPKIIVACTDVKKSMTLRVSLPGEKEEGE